MWPGLAAAGQPEATADLLAAGEVRAAVPSTCRMSGGRGTVWTTATRETWIGRSNPSGAQSRAV